MVLTWYIGAELSAVNLSKKDLVLPAPYLAIFFSLLIFERKAILNVLSTEFKQITPRQTQHWIWFQKSWYFWILVLMAVIWRSYFRIVILVFPLLGYIYRHFQLSYEGVYWPLKLPYWIAFGWIAYRELRLVADIIEPPIHPVSVVSEWWSRALQIALIAFFMTSLTVMMKGQIDLSKGVPAAILHSFPFMLIVFTFFYVPIRWVEILTDTIDCHTKIQVVLFWLTTYLLMLTALEPRILSTVIHSQ
ncbi:MAG: hypothetical protein HUU01_15255 [Saprospiraceae bacterium]|nr:hypothetical protein [Saprospiraceae bacterium]